MRSVRFLIVPSTCDAVGVLTSVNQLARCGCKVRLAIVSLSWLEVSKFGGFLVDITERHHEFLLNPIVFDCEPDDIFRLWIFFQVMTDGHARPAARELERATSVDRATYSLT